MVVQTYPVVQASLNMLTESAVITKASAQARCPICGLGPEEHNINPRGINLVTVKVGKTITRRLETVYLHQPRCKPLD